MATTIRVHTVRATSTAAFGQSALGPKTKARIKELKAFIASFKKEMARKSTSAGDKADFQRYISEYEKSIADYEARLASEDTPH